MTQPGEYLVSYMRKYPKTGAFVDDFRSNRAGFPAWPDWCFLPMGAWYAIVSEAQTGGNLLGLEHIADVSALAALGTWRYSQGIYQIHPDMLSALTDSTIFGDLPAEVFLRLPEWCIYIETPGMDWYGKPMEGFFAHLEWDANEMREELRLLVNTNDTLYPVPLHIGNWTVAESVNRATEEAKKQAATHELGFERELAAFQDLIHQVSDQYSKLISILLYICSDAPEIDDAREPGQAAARPKPVKTKKGWRLFPAERIRVWKIGQKTGDKLKVHRIAGGGTTKNRSVRAHLRRGHWHGYWTGPKSEKQTFVYRWIHPLIAGGQSVTDGANT